MDFATGDDEDGTFGLEVYRADVAVRVGYEYVSDVALEDDDHDGASDVPGEDDDHDGASDVPGEDDDHDGASSGWAFTIEARGDGHTDWSVIAEGLVETLPEAAAVAVFVLDEHVPGQTKAHATHHIGGSEEAFATQFAGAFDIRVGSPDLLPEDVEVEQATE